MPQIFWATCPDCGTKFSCEKFLWDRNDPLMCPNCLLYFAIKDSPEIEATYPLQSGALDLRDKSES